MFRRHVYLLPLACNATRRATGKACLAEDPFNESKRYLPLVSSSADNSGRESPEFHPHPMNDHAASPMPVEMAETAAHAEGMFAGPRGSRQSVRGSLLGRLPSMQGQVSTLTCVNP